MCKVCASRAQLIFLQFFSKFTCTRCPKTPQNYCKNQLLLKFECSLELVVAIMKQSKNFEQFIKYQCNSSALIYDMNNVHGCWVSCQGSRINYWGGAAVNSGKCACGMTNSCAGGRNVIEMWMIIHEGSGYLRNKSTLPVTELRFRDTGDSENHTLE